MRISQESLNALVTNTVAVLTSVPDKIGEWTDSLKEVQRQIEAQGTLEETVFINNLLQLLTKDKITPMPDDNPYKQIFQRIQDTVNDYHSKSDAEAISISENIQGGNINIGGQQSFAGNINIGGKRDESKSEDDE